MRSRLELTLDLCTCLQMHLPADQQAQSQDTARTHESFAAQSSWPHPFGSFEEHELQRGPSGNSSRQAVTDGSNGSALGDLRDWQPPRQELGRFVPPGMVCYHCNVQLCDANTCSGAFPACFILTAISCISGVELHRLYLAPFVTQCTLLLCSNASSQVVVSKKNKIFACSKTGYYIRMFLNACIL